MGSAALPRGGGRQPIGRARPGRDGRHSRPVDRDPDLGDRTARRAAGDRRSRIHGGAPHRGAAPTGVGHRSRRASTPSPTSSPPIRPRSPPTDRCVRPWRRRRPPPWRPSRSARSQQGERRHPRLRPHRAHRAGARRRRGRGTPATSPASPDEAEAVVDALRSPVGAPRWPSSMPRRRGAARSWRHAAPGGGGVPRRDPAHAEPHRAAPACWPSSRRAGAGPAEIELLCATGTHRAATHAEMVELVGGVPRGALSASTSTTPSASDHVEVGRVDGVPVQHRPPLRRSRRPHPHRVRRAALLRRLQRRPQRRLPRPRRPRHHPRGPQPPPHRRPAGRRGSSPRATPSTTSCAPPWPSSPPTLSLDVAINNGRGTRPPCSPGRSPLGTPPPAGSWRTPPCSASAIPSTSW